MTDIILSLDDIIKTFSNTYGFESVTTDSVKLFNLVLNIIKMNKTKSFLIEDYFANIDESGIQIHQDKRDIFCINRFKTITYNSIDPTFRIINTNGNYVITYIYDNISYYSIPMTSYNIDIISNYGFFHDVIFSHILKIY